MKKDSKTPHLGMIVTLGVLIAAIWMLAIYDTIQDAHEEKYDVSVRPGAVSYGTHSSATMPMVSAPTRHTAAPMISGSAVRSYAHYGHASYAHNPSPVTAIYTTSSATVHTIGSGGASGGLSSSPSGDRGASSSRGITYGGASVAMPTLALATPSLAATPSAQGYNSGVNGPRRAPSYTGDPSDGDYAKDDEDPNKWWQYDGEEWVEVEVRVVDGIIYAWIGGEWVPITDKDQADPTIPQPIGATPWLLMLLLALGYGIAKMRLRKRIHG